MNMMIMMMMMNANHDNDNILEVMQFLTRMELLRKTSIRFIIQIITR